VSVVAPPPLRPAPKREDPELLIEEARARQRQRRRRVLTAATAVLAAGAAAAGIVHAVGGSTATAAGLPKGVFANRSAFAGHGVLAFVSRGRLFVLDGVTRRVRMVSPAGVQTSDPRFSPDGRWLAYTVGRERLGVARADGSAARVFPHDGGAAWLPNGELAAADGIFRVASNGNLARVGAEPKGLAAWSPDGDRFAFVSRTIVHGRDGAFHGTETLSIAGSLDGRRTAWRSTPFTFTRSSGFSGNVIGGVQILPHREGVLFWTDPDQSASMAADGMAVYELRAPMAKPVELAVSVGGRDVSVGANGALAIGAGPNRYAWLTKDVVTCGASGRCTHVPVAPGRLTIDPAWSPDGKTLAYVEAAARPASDFRQATIVRWYATHTLRLLRPGAAHATTVAGTSGAAVPAWSNDGRSLLYVAGDALWLVPSLGARPEKIAGPLFPPNAWPSYYGQIGWSTQFAWASP